MRAPRPHPPGAPAVTAPVRHGVAKRGPRHRGARFAQRRQEMRCAAGGARYGAAERTSFCHPMTDRTRHRWSPGRVGPRGMHALRENMHRTSPRKILVDGERRVGGVLGTRRGTPFPMVGAVLAPRGGGAPHGGCEHPPSWGVLGEHPPFWGVLENTSKPCVPARQCDFLGVTERGPSRLRL